MRNAARRWRSALGRPLVQRDPQRALYRRRIQRIAEAADRRPSVAVAEAVLVAGDEIEARLRMVGEIGLARRVRVKERCALHPVFVLRIDLHRQRTGVRFRAGIVAARGLARDRIGGRLVREREHALGVELILPVALGAPRLREAIVHVDAVAGGDPLHHAVEHDLAVLGLIEAEIAEVVQHAPGLRRHLGVDARDVAGERVRRAGIVRFLVAQEGVEVAHGGEADAVHRRILGRIGELVDVVRLERCARGQKRDRRAVVVIRPAAWPARPQAHHPGARGA